ncbi:MAG: DUF4436 family protein, partial [Humibacter sp.]
MGDGANTDASDDSARVKPPRRRPRVSRLLVIIVGAFIVVYAVVVTLYALSGRVAGLGSTEPEPESGGVTVVLNVERVDAAAQRIDLNVSIDPSQTLLTGDQFSLTTDIHVIVSPIQGSQAIVFKAQSPPSTQTVEVFASGEIENWPFDIYRADKMVVLAYVDSDGVARPIPTNVWLTGGVPGWNVDAQQVGKAPAELPQTLPEALNTLPTIDVWAPRSGSTIAFAFVLLALLVAMPCLVLYVAIMAFR